jgi:hypothetical protein
MDKSADKSDNIIILSDIEPQYDYYFSENEDIRWTDLIGQNLIESVEFNGYNQFPINEEYATNPDYDGWMDSWKEYMDSQNSTSSTSSTNSDTIHVPLEFWFNKDPGLALPSYALSYYDTNLEIQDIPLDQTTEIPNPYSNKKNIRRGAKKKKKKNYY